MLPTNKNKHNEYNEQPFKDDTNLCPKQNAEKSWGDWTFGSGWRKNSPSNCTYIALPSNQKEQLDEFHVFPLSNIIFDSKGTTPHMVNFQVHVR